MCVFLDFAIQFSVDIKVIGNSQSKTEQSSPHPESDSGTVALIAIAILSAILIIASVVRILNLNFELYPITNKNPISDFYVDNKNREQK